MAAGNESATIPSDLRLRLRYASLDFTDLKGNKIAPGRASCLEIWLNQHAGQQKDGQGIVEMVEVAIVQYNNRSHRTDYCKLSAVNIRKVITALIDNKTVRRAALNFNCAQ